MRPHHTKNKGDLGVLHAKVDLAEKGYRLLLPLSEHEAFDLVAYREGVFLRVQVKYRAASNGVIHVPFSTCWADRHGTHTSLVDKEQIDVMCVYCPDSRACYYLDPLLCGRDTALRLDPPKNCQLKRVLFAKDFVDIPASILVRRGLVT